MISRNLQWWIKCDRRLVGRIPTVTHALAWSS
jgi:hypothetical protein